MKKKILFIHHGKGLGGAPLSLLYLIQALDASRYTPIVLFLYSSDIIDLYKQRGIKTLGPLNMMDFPHTKIWWLRWYHAHVIMRSIIDTIKTAFFVAPTILDKIKPDIVHLNTSSLIGWGFATHRKKIPLAWHIREPLAQGYCGIRRRIIQTCVKRYASAIIPICKNDAQPWKEEQSTRIVYNTVNHDIFDYRIDPTPFFLKHNIQAHRPLVLFLGGLSEEKGTLIILKAFELLKNRMPDAQLLLAGLGDFKKQSTVFKSFFPAAQFKKNILCSLRTLGDSVKPLGPLYDVPAAMAASSIVVFPATVGHFARPVIEAGFMKKPVIASNLAPLNELVVHNKTGFLINPYDYNAWADSIFLLLNDQTRNTLMGEEAYTFCMTTFNIHNHMHHVHDIYQNIYKKGALNKS